MRQRRLSPGLTAAILAATALAAVLLCVSPGALLAWPPPPRRAPPPPAPRRPEWGPARPPSFAYWISGTRNDSRRALRLLRAAYHPRNRYLLHLDAAAGDDERAALARAVRRDPAWREFRNVDVVGAGHAVDRAGASALAAALHGAAVLLKVGRHWDWLVTLSAEDYPLVTQDASS